MEDKKITEEKEIVKKMILLFCKGNKHDRKECDLCRDCSKLYDYACLRISKCPFLENKPFCSKCKIKCYNKSMQEKIQTVMRYSGPRMIFHNPALVIRHFIDNRKRSNQ